ncbi:MFS transporter [uncultured Microbacterium sp.]|uniref:MFS transporter n=1 Tax=uncultured Microbacterium sp. TaxID=191216 RepID=UPI0025E9BBCE|nr:MFS transporter [uncultured Microbacterium sp.]
MTHPQHPSDPAIAPAAMPRAQFVRWRTAVFAIFALSGLSVATWASRVPAIKAELGLDTLGVGLLLLSAGIASIIGLSLAPVVAARLGARTGMRIAMLVFALGVALVGIGAEAVQSPAVVAVGLAFFGLGNGSVDVMMNVEGAAIEQRQGGTLLPMFHAFFSLGTVIGASLGALAASLQIGVLPHALAIAVVIVVASFVTSAAVPRVDASDPTRSADAGAPRRSIRERLDIALSAWREPRTYALGVIMLGMSFAEGGANDWLALGVTQGHGHGDALGAIGLAVFSASMTIARLAGGPLIDRFGRLATLRVLAVTAVIGMLMFILAPNVPLILIGAFLWGAGVSMGFPLGMSAAADDPARAAARVSACATIGYVAFLAGPPLLGFLAEHLGLLNTLFIVAGLVAASGLFSGAARPMKPAQPVPAAQG